MISESEQSAIIRSLENILADDKFSGSPQMSAFLRYVVTETLQGNAERIKAYTVAVDALGKSESFDPQNDPSVRVLAKRLRTCLDHYYERTSNHERIIEIRAGSYKPIFSDPGVAYDKLAGVTRYSNELPESRHTRALGIQTHKAPSNQASFKPVIAVSDKKQSALEVAALGNTATAPATQESNIAESSHRLQQQEDACLSPTSVKDQKKTQAPKANKISMLVNLIETAQANKMLSGAALLLTLATVTWGFNDLTRVSAITEAASVNNQDKYALQLASANGDKSLRQRPAVPSVIVRTNSREDKISQSLLSSISHVLSKFDHLQVLKSTHEYELTEKWPEDYEIVVDTLVMNDSKKITVNLINAASGRITYSDELVLNGGVATSFSKNNITAVELFVARIAQKNGPLLSDYKNQEEYSETMACVFSITATDYESQTGDDCLNKVIAPGQSEVIQHTLRTELSLIKLAKISGSKRKTALKKALAEAQKSIELAPHSADAHALMMRVLRLSGDYSTAFKHGTYAMDINKLDSSNMLAFAVLLDDMKKPSEADEMRKQASVLSTTLYGISL